tara:strand:+ start:65 stop:502 length:438 start_codon:yes stop_codon:yes gene_type:complete
MPIDLRDKMSGGGQYTVKTATGYQTIPSGASGDLIILSDAGGADVRLDALVSNRLTVGDGEISMEIEVDGTVMITGTLSGRYPADDGVGSFAVLQTGANAGSQDTIQPLSRNVGYLSDVVGKTVIVRKTSGSLSSSIAYTATIGK